MKLITLRVGESVLLGPGVILSLVGFKGDKARLGIVAPKEVQVCRPEAKNKAAKPGRTDPRELTER